MVSFDMSNLVTKFVVKYNVMGKYLTQEEVITRLTNTFGDKLDISKVKYIDAKTKVKVKCNVCSHEFEAKPLHLFNGHGCPKCARALVGKKCRNSTDKFIEKANEVHNYKYDYSKVTYVTNRVNVCIVCPIHGEFYQTPHSHLSGNGCPKCLYKSQYKLYSRLCNEFPDLEILYEYSPDWLGKQRFDIYIPKYNIAIEYNGEQHYKPIARFGGVLRYNKTVERDSYKLEKCKANNCKLYVLRYDYKNDDLQEIINTIQSLN